VNARREPAGAGRPAPRYALLGPALLLTSGRGFAYIAAFFVPVVLARILTTTEFGTYKQIFLVYMLLFHILQLGVSQSLYYFVPRSPERAGRYAWNAVLVLGGVGLVSSAALALSPGAVQWLVSNPRLGTYVGLLALYLLLTLVSQPFEILLVCRKNYRGATWAYALSDLARAVLVLVPTVLTGRLDALMVGVVIFSVVRLVAFLVFLRRTYGDELRAEMGLLREQLGYSLPFGLAVLVSTLQMQYHQLVVSHAFDAATFAIYAVGCLQVPIVDFVFSPTADLMMVRMTEALRSEHPGEALATWHDAIGTLALLFFPLVGAILVMARPLIVVLFTSAYAASVPIFMLWSLTIVVAPLLTDSVLRVFAATRFLLAVNLLQLGAVAVLIGPMLRRFGLIGAVLATLAALGLARAVALVRIGRQLRLGIADLLPWRQLGVVGVAASAAYGAARLAVLPLAGSLVLELVVGGAAYALAYALLAWWWGFAPALPIGRLRARFGRGRGSEAHSQAEAG